MEVNLNVTFDDLKYSLGKILNTEFFAKKLVFTERLLGNRTRIIDSTRSYNDQTE